MVFVSKRINSYILNYAVSSEELMQSKMKLGDPVVNKDLEGCECVIFERTISS
jgi:hypothetical protein